MLVTTKLEFADYSRATQHFESMSLYHGERWLNAIRNGFGAEVFGLLTTSVGGEVIALTPVMSIRKGFLRLAGSPLRGMYTEFAGPLFARDVCEKTKREAVASQHAYLKRMGAAYVEWGVKGSDDAEAHDYMHSLRGQGYAHAPSSTFVVDVGCGPDKVWSGFESRARNMVRKAEKNGVVARAVVPTEVDVTNYYGMLTQTFRQQGKQPAHPLAFFQAVCTYLVPAGLLRFIVAEKGGQVVAGALFLCHKERMVYLSGASTEEGARLAANSLVQWVAMQRAAERGVVEYDLGGAGVHATIDKFKASFGGKLCTHHRWVYRSWPIRLVEPIYRRLASKGWVRLHG